MRSTHIQIVAVQGGRRNLVPIDRLLIEDRGEYTLVTVLGEPEGPWKTEEPYDTLLDRITDRYHRQNEYLDPSS